MILLLPGLEIKTTLSSGTASLPGDHSLQGDGHGVGGGSVSTDLTTSFTAHDTQILSINWD